MTAGDRKSGLFLKILSPERDKEILKKRDTYVSLIEV